MFTEGPIDGVVFRQLELHADDRGWLVELFRDDELASDHRPRMAYLSQTAPGVTRGPHEHVDQTDCFVFAGPGNFRLCLWDARPESETRGRRISARVGAAAPTLVIVPPGVVHAYRCLGPEPGLVFNGPNRLYRGEGRRGPLDEIRHEERDHSPYVIEAE